MSEAAPRLTVVVPTLDEEERLPALLEDLRALGESVALVVVDGGSRDATRAVAAGTGARVLRAPRGRASQLRAGASAVRTPWLAFLHADTRLPAGARDALVGFLDQAHPDDFAHFAFGLEGDDWFWRFIELGQRLRQQWLGLAYGDQGLVVSRALYERVGGYPEWPILEDVGLLDRLTRCGTVHRLDTPLPTSPRRYQVEGRWTGWLRNLAVIALFRLGVSPERLAARHPSRRTPPAGGDGGGRTVALFAKAPRPGRVKTRLAAEVGAEEAARIYRAIGRRVVDALRGGDYRLLVFHDPPDPEAAGEIERWLGAEGIELRPQAAGDLGARMSAAFRECLAESGRVCLVGTDVPGIDRPTVEHALAALDEADVVLGPALDGGYYLVGLRRPCPELFEHVAWSTDAVLPTTLERCRRLGLTSALLEPLADVDTRRDVPLGLLRA